MGLSDPVLLLQYLTNLLSNAAKFTETGHVLVICDVTQLNEEWSSVSLGVADTGPGIPEADQERVLTAFTTGNAVPREDAGTATRSTGIGLRLANLIAQILGKQGPNHVANTHNKIHIQSPLPAPLRSKIPGGGRGTYLNIMLNLQHAAPDQIASFKSGLAEQASST